MNRVANIEDMAPESFAEVMDANVTQSWLLARAATRRMKAQGDGGKIVLVSSARGLLGHPGGYTAYCASKAAVDGITKALGCELGPTGITVNAIAPTVFRSPPDRMDVRGHAGSDEGIREGFLTRLPKGRLGETGGSRRPVAVPRVAGVGLLHRAHPSTRTAAIRRDRPMIAIVGVVGAGLMGHGIALTFAQRQADGSRSRPRRRSP